MIKQRLTYLSAVLTLLAFMIMPAAHAAFNQNLLIDDGTFSASGSMTSGQIDAFLNSFPNSCISPNSGFDAKLPTGYTPSGGYTYGGFTTAGNIIATSAQVYGLNPRVLLTTLQKEQSLVSGATNFCNNGDENKYSAAMGYGCPDSGTVYNWSGVSLYRRNGVERTSTGSTCVNTAIKAGFSQQTIRAAWLLKFGQQRSQGNINWAVITGSWDNSDDPQTCYGGPMTEGYRQVCPSGATTFYDGYKTIDGTAVHMDSGGTAALYWYTPHFHGNQNFVSIYEGWFGSTIANTTRLELSAGTPVAIAGNADGTLQVVGITNSDTIYTKRQTAPNTDSWGAWGQLPGALRNISAETNSDGRVELVGVAYNGNIYFCSQTAPNSTTWSAWLPMDGGLSNASLARNFDGSLEVIGLAPDGSIFHRRQNTPSSDDWGAWSQLPGALNTITAETNADGRIQVVGIANNGSIYTSSETAPNGATWSAWTPVDGALYRGALARNTDGTLEIVGIASTGAIYHKRQASANSATWGAWTPLPGALKNLGAQANMDERLQVVGVAGNGNIYESSEVSTNSTTWSAWMPMDGALRRN